MCVRPGFYINIGEDICFVVLCRNDKILTLLPVLRIELIEQQIIDMLEDSKNIVDLGEHFVICYPKFAIELLLKIDDIVSCGIMLQYQMKEIYSTYINLKNAISEIPNDPFFNDVLDQVKSIEACYID